MLAFGRALMSDPKIILMDEPSMGLAPSLVETIMESIQAIAQRGIGVLMVEQNASAALAVADTAVVIERGEIILRGTAAGIARDSNVSRVFLGGSDELGGSEELLSAPAE
jgi:branched-chain amino acid transport system ATP-binding protein